MKQISKSPVLTTVLLIAAISFIHTFTFAQKQNLLRQSVGKVINAVKAKDHLLLDSLLDPMSRVGNFPIGMNDQIIPDLLKKIPSPNTYKIAKIEKESGGKRVYITCIYGSKEVRKHSLLYNTDGKIIDFDMLDTMSKTSSALPPVNNVVRTYPNRFEVPFELHKNIIVMKAKLNGEEKNFIFDNGAQGLTLNQDQISLPKDSSYKAISMGFGGTAHITFVNVGLFEWGGLIINDFKCPAGSFKHIDSQLGIKTAGILGHSLYKDYELIFDYKKKTITFIRTDDSGNYIKPAPADSALASVVPFEMTVHMPVITVSIGSKQYKMGIDCGSAVNSFPAEYIHEIKDEISDFKETAMIGSAAKRENVKICKIKMLSVGKTPYSNMSFFLTNEGPNSSMKKFIDGGLLGAEFLSRYRTALNYKKKELRIYVTQQ